MVYPNILHMQPKHASNTGACCIYFVLLPSPRYTHTDERLHTNKASRTISFQVQFQSLCLQSGACPLQQLFCHYLLHLYVIARCIFHSLFLHLFCAEVLNSHGCILHTISGGDLWTAARNCSIQRICSNSIHRKDL
jgi:hypothetical protein